MFRPSAVALFYLASWVSADDAPTDTYKQCEIPSFEWAAYGTRLTGRMYTRRAALLGDDLFAAGYLKSTGVPEGEGFVDTEEDFGVTGPYTNADPIGASASSVTSDLISYSTEYGSFAQYEVGVVKIDRVTGTPLDVFVYYGEGQDETCGLAARETTSGERVLAISGHFVGSLSADLGNDVTMTINNSNALGGADFVVHPNAILNGFDDGFVISADATTGVAKWIVAHPKSTRDAQTVGVDVDAAGNIYGAGYACNGEPDDDAQVTCDGFVAMFAADDGAIVWEREFPDLGAAMWIAYDDTDGALYVTGTSSYGGSAEDDEPDEKLHPHCAHEVCAVTMRLSAADGETHWIRTIEGSPRWNFFDQTGDVRLAADADGPYVYVALDDAGENGEVTLDGGTPYAGCLPADGTAAMPEYELVQDRTLAPEDCPVNSTFVSRMEGGVQGAVDAATGAMCGAGHDAVDACIIKYHKYTGLPVWGADVPPVASVLPAPDGQSVAVVGFYYPDWGHFDSVVLPNYNGVEGAYNAKLDAATGRGIYAMHSGGSNKDRPYDAVVSPEGDIYIVGYTQSQVIDWGGTLQTKIIEEGYDQNDDVGTAFQMGKMGSKTSEYQFFAVKLAAGGPETVPSCVTTCPAEGAVAVVTAGSCFIDNVCYEAGDTAELFGRPCLVCDPAADPTSWSYSSTIGVSECLVDNVCRTKGEFATYRESRSVTHTSLCQWCEPTVNTDKWSIMEGFQLVDDANAPDDCTPMEMDKMEDTEKIMSDQSSSADMTDMTKTMMPQAEESSGTNGFSGGAITGVNVALAIVVAFYVV